MTGNEFSVELSDIHMRDFEDGKPTTCSVSFCVTRVDQDPSGSVSLFFIDDLLVNPDLNELVREARSKLDGKLRTLAASVSRTTTAKVEA